MSAATLFAAILNSLSRFAAAAAAPILLNICLIGALLLGLFTGDGGEASKAATGLYLAISVSLSGLFQLGWLYHWIRRSGFHPALRRPRLTAGVSSEEHTSELQSLMRISYAVFCLKKKKKEQQIIEA